MLVYQRVAISFWRVEINQWKPEHLPDTTSGREPFQAKVAPQTVGGPKLSLWKKIRSMSLFFLGFFFLVSPTDSFATGSCNESWLSGFNRQNDVRVFTSHIGCMKFILYGPCTVVVPGACGIDAKRHRLTCVEFWFGGMLHRKILIYYERDKLQVEFGYLVHIPFLKVERYCWWTKSCTTWDG